MVDNIHSNTYTIEMYSYNICFQIIAKVGYYKNVGNCKLD
jgi:hypothetical protein